MYDAKKNDTKIKYFKWIWYLQLKYIFTCICILVIIIGLPTTTDVKKERKKTGAHSYGYNTEKIWMLSIQIYRLIYRVFILSNLKAMNTFELVYT